MPAFGRSIDSLSFLTETARDILRRRLRELAGLALILVALLLAVALATWSVQDPSLSHATNAPVRNVLGLPGAIIADLLMQLLGIAALALVLPIAIWGWRMVTHRPLHRERIRFAVWIAGILLFADFVACLPRTSAWPLPAGLGGVVGDGMLRLALIVVGETLFGFTRIVIGFVTGLAALLAFAIAAGYGWQARLDMLEESRGVVERDERAAISIGFIVHGLISLKSRLMRLLVWGRPSSWRRHASRSQSERAEPHFD